MLLSWKLDSVPGPDWAMVTTKAEVRGQSLIAYFIVIYIAVMIGIIKWSFNFQCPVNHEGHIRAIKKKKSLPRVKF